MKTLLEIIEDVKNNKKPDYEELRYALLALDFMAGTDHRNLREELLSEKRSPEFIREMKAQNSCDMCRNALNKSPKEFVGWDNNPENPEYQKRRKVHEKIYENFLSEFEKGEA